MDEAVSSLTGQGLIYKPVRTKSLHMPKSQKLSGPNKIIRFIKLCVCTLASSFSSYINHRPPGSLGKMCLWDKPCATIDKLCSLIHSHFSVSLLSICDGAQVEQ